MHVPRPSGSSNVSGQVPPDRRSSRVAQITDHSGSRNADWRDWRASMRPVAALKWPTMAL